MEAPREAEDMRVDFWTFFHNRAPNHYDLETFFLFLFFTFHVLSIPPSTYFLCISCSAADIALAGARRNE